MGGKKDMKKLVPIFVIFVLLGTMIVTSQTISVDRIEKTPFPIKTGNFEGEIFAESEVIGIISGTFAFYPIIKDGLAITKFNGIWEISVGEYAGTTGTVIGFGGKFFQFGRITIDGTGEKFSVISQISFNEINYRFSGNLKLILGSSFYTSGDYQEN
jgi:hypothetical protein